MLGVLNVYKPAGPTSRDVVGRVHAAVRRGLGVKKIKVGHAGTLDPLAEGVLGVCLGRATRLIEYLQDGRKEYRATFAFGVTSDSLDNETEPRPVGGSENVTETSLAATLPNFIGTIAQVPPAFSAVRIDGQRAFDLARQGRDVAPEPRPVVVDRFELDRLEPGEHGPVGTFTITCGAGTYVRSLGRDVAAALGTAAVMTALTRTRVGPLKLEDAVPFADLTFETVAARLLPPESALGDMPRVTLDGPESDAFRHGSFVPRPHTDAPPGPRAVFAADGKLLGVGRFDPVSGALRPRAVLEPPRSP